MQVDPAVGERVLIGLWGTEVSVSKQELEGRLSCTSSRSQDIPQEGHRW